MTEIEYQEFVRRCPYDAMSLLSITIFFRLLVIRNYQRSIPDSSKDIIRVY